MSDEPNSGPVAESTPAPVDNTPLSVDDAMGVLKSRREAPVTPQDSPAKAEDPAPVKEPSSGEIDQSQADPVADEALSIEPPRSWTKEEKEWFSTLPPERQQSLAEREKARETDFLRRQNEVAESKKAAESEKQTAEAKRREYESALPNLLNQLQTLHSLEFQDVKSWDDVQRMAATDPVRFGQWQAAQGKIQAVAQEAQAAQQRQQQEAVQQFDKWATEQDKIFFEKAPEFSDPEKVAKVSQEVVDYLTKDIGLQVDDLIALRDGKASISLRDSRAQLIIRDAARYRAAEKARLAAAPRQIPPVQRPGTPSSSPVAEKIQELSARLDRSGSAQDAIAMLKAMRARK